MFANIPCFSYFSSYKLFTHILMGNFQKSLNMIFSRSFMDENINYELRIYPRGERKNSIKKSKKIILR